MSPPNASISMLSAYANMIQVMSNRFRKYMVENHGNDHRGGFHPEDENTKNFDLLQKIDSRMMLTNTASMRSFIILSIVITLLNVPILVISFTDNQTFTGVCSNRIDPLQLRSDQMTVLINGYSEHRIPLLYTIAAIYSASSSVSDVIILWCNPSTSSQIISEFSYNLTVQSTVNAPISVHRETSRSLNSRFYPRESIKTRGVLICDDDVELDSKSIDFAFRIWKSNSNRLVGFFARSHAYDLASKSWIYTVHPDKYSIILTKAVLLHTEMLFQYTCMNDKNWPEMRKYVDKVRNCEDILMNFVAAERGNAGPILVAAERVRDLGDARNEGGRSENERTVGLSSRRKEHRRRRGDCITEFHRISGAVPLRYNYGKVANSVGEQGLCEKGGRLVFCDE